MMTRASRSRDTVRAARWGIVVLALGCGDDEGSASPGERSASTVTVSADELCGGDEYACCPAPRSPCARGLRCDEATGRCRVDSDRPDAVLLCRSDADCMSGRRCCSAGAYGTCEAVEPSTACALPDLAVLASGEGVTISEDAFDGVTPSDGGCVRERGMRRRLQAAVAIANLGTADFILGGPDVEPDDHVSARDEFLRYSLIHASGKTLAESKAPLPCSDRGDPQLEFSCAFAGLPAGSLMPTAGVECEALDVTELAPGSYRLRVELVRSWPDADPSNGLVELPVELPSFDPLAPCLPVPNPLQGLDFYRECGWSRARLPGDGTCEPGTAARLDCEQCTANPFLRVCAGDETCSAASAISDALGWFLPGMTEPCAALQVICPWMGRYSVMMASEDPSLTGAPCTLVYSTEF